MKLGKEEIKKLALGGLLLVALVYGYFEFLLSPLSRKQRSTVSAIGALQPKIEEAQTQIRKTQRMEAEAPDALARMQQIASMIPEGSPVAWFPPRVADVFRREGLERAQTRMNAEAPERDLAGYRRMAWGVELSKASFIPFAQALADFENTEPLAEVVGLQIEAARENAGSQRVTLTVSNIVKQ
jgi:hypothetical protein